MKYIGIDYGKRKIGLALSDESGALAFPHSVIDASKQAVPTICSLITAEGVQCVVLGHPGVQNAIIEDVEQFKGELEAQCGCTVVFQDEAMTTSHTHHFLDRKPKARMHKKNTPRSDASAAALLLQRYLETH